MNYAGLQLVTAPTAEPLSLQDALDHLRVDQGVDDAYVTLAITLARQQCETILRRALMTQTWMLSLQNWPGRDYQNWPVSFTSELDIYYKYNYIKIPLPPLQGVTFVKYMNSDGQILCMAFANFTTTVPNGYNVITAFEPGRIVLPFSQIWPTDILMPGAPIQIQFVCGYADLATLQSSFEGFASTIHAMKMLISYFYENRVPPAESRKSMIPAGLQFVVEELLTPYRIYE